MGRRVEAEPVRRSVIGQARKELEQAAGGNEMLAKTEEKALTGDLAAAAKQARKDVPKYGRLYVDDVVDRYAPQVTSEMKEVNQPSGPGKRWFSIAETKALENPETRCRVWEARTRVLTAKHARRFAPISIAAFKAKINEAWPSNTPHWTPRYSPQGIPLINYKNKLSDQIRDDLSTVSFNTENTEYSGHYRSFPNALGVQVTDNGMPYLALSSGGDWEYPVFYIIYWDGEQLRGYVPEEGNVYNKTANKAFGNEDEDVERAEVRRQLHERSIPIPPELASGHSNDLADLLPDHELLLADIKKNIVAQ